jgi:cation transport ATPase
MTTLPSTVRATRYLLFLNALCWMAFAIIAAVGAHPSYKDPNAIRWAMTAMGLVVAAILAILATQLEPGNRLTYWASVMLLTAMTLGGLLDELGLADLAFLLITILPLALLIKHHRWYLGAGFPAR